MNNPLEDAFNSNFSFFSGVAGLLIKVLIPVLIGVAVLFVASRIVAIAGVLAVVVGLGCFFYACHGAWETIRSLNYGFSAIDFQYMAATLWQIAKRGSEPISKIGVRKKNSPGAAAPGDDEAPTSGWGWIMFLPGPGLLFFVVNAIINLTRWVFLIFLWVGLFIGYTVAIVAYCAVAAFRKIINPKKRSA